MSITDLTPEQRRAEVDSLLKEIMPRGGVNSYHLKNLGVHLTIAAVQRDFELVGKANQLLKLRAHSFAISNLSGDDIQAVLDLLCAQTDAVVALEEAEKPEEIEYGSPAHLVLGCLADFHGVDEAFVAAMTDIESGRVLQIFADLARRELVYLVTEGRHVRRVLTEAGWTELQRLELVKITNPQRDGLTLEEGAMLEFIAANDSMKPGEFRGVVPLSFIELIEGLLLMERLGYVRRLGEFVYSPWVATERGRAFLIAVSR